MQIGRNTVDFLQVVKQASENSASQTHQISFFLIKHGDDEILVAPGGAGMVVAKEDARFKSCSHGHHHPLDDLSK